jgi:hypothetical protein
MLPTAAAAAAAAVHLLKKSYSSLTQEVSAALTPPSASVEKGY